MEHNNFSWEHNDLSREHDHLSWEHNDPKDEENKTFENKEINKNRAKEQRVPGHLELSDNHMQPPLTIYYVHDAPHTRQKLEAEVRVLRDFAIAWNKKHSDMKGAMPVNEALLCSVLFVSCNQHLARPNRDGSEGRAHMTVFVASAETWAQGYARSCCHVFSIDERPSLGFCSWERVDTKKNSFDGKQISAALANAEATDLDVAMPGDPNRIDADEWNWVRETVCGEEVWVRDPSFIFLFLEQGHVILNPTTVELLATLRHYKPDVPTRLSTADLQLAISSMIMMITMILS
ncbi:hypothetical protein NHJ13051_005056 [Beauveria bassiana]